MFRSMLSIVAVASLAAAVPSGAAVDQSKPAAAQAPAKAASTAIVNINTATAAELDGLPGIGAKTAALIVEYRQKNGPFKKIEELMNVRGVGEKNFLKLKDHITVAAVKTDRASQQ